jgi:predicted transcriptional regulator
MSEASLQQAIEIVKAQAAVRSMTEEEIVRMIHGLSKSLSAFSSGSDSGPGETAQADIPADKGVKASSVVCLECGKKFRLLSTKHLASHGLTAAEYREKWGMKRGASLACKTLQKSRREKMKSMQLWTRRKPAPAPAETKPVKVRTKQAPAQAQVPDPSQD